MSNTALLQVRVNAADREKASEILEALGTNLSAAVNMLIKQIIITEGIPFEVRKTNRAVHAKGRFDRKIPSEEIEVIPAKPTLTIPADEYVSIIGLIPEGRVARFDDINRYFEKKYQVENVQSDYSGWPQFDNNGKEIPYWRIIGTRGAVGGVHNYNATMQYERLTKEGVALVPYKSIYRVVDYKAYLYSM